MMDASTLVWTGAGALVACLMAAPGRANDQGTCCGDTVRWFTSTPTFKLLPVSFQGSPVADAALVRFNEAVTAWNQIPGSRLRWTVTFDDDNQRTNRGDGTEVGFFAGPADGGVLAQTGVRWGVCPWPLCDEEISEADIRFFNANANGPINWNVDPLPGAYFQRQVPDPNADPGAAPSDLQNFFVAVASHEIGHACGLEHTTQPSSRMEDTTPNGGWFHRGELRATPLSNDQAEMRRIYGTEGAASDTYLLSWQTNTFSDTLPVTANPFGGDVSETPRNDTVNRGDDNTAVVPGDLLGVRFCTGNLGNLAQPVSGLELWLSADQEVDTNDALSPTTVSFNPFPPNSFGCFLVDFLVPPVPSGRFFVGLWLNRAAAVGQSITNDVTILGRRVNVL